MSDSRPLALLVDAVSARVGGGGTHVVSQLGALDEVRDIEMTIHAIGSVADDLARACPRARIVREPRRGLVRRLAWEQTVLAARSRRYDALYVPGNFALFLTRTPQVLTIQKASLFTDAHRDFRRRRCSPSLRARLACESVLSRRSIQRATRVVAVSRSLGAAIEADLGRLENLHVIPSAPPELTPPEGNARWDPPLPDHYALVVSTDLPHKDWDGLVEVFAARRDLPPLVIAGASSPARQEALKRQTAMRGVSGRVRLLGAVSDRSEVAALFSGADCCLVHSHIEAVGLTGLEALSLGVPIAASDIPAHHEILGSAAVYYPLDDPERLAEAVRRAIELPAKQPVAVTRETWPGNAEALADVIRRAVRGCPE